MKKLLLMLIVILVFNLTACKNNESMISPNDTNKNQESETLKNDYGMDELVSKVINDCNFENEVVGNRTSYNDILELSGDEYNYMISKATDISFNGGQIYIFKMHDGIDSSDLFEKAKSLDIGSWYRFYNEKYVIIDAKSYLVLMLANNEVNAPETDAKIIKETLLDYFGDVNIKNIFEKDLEGTHISIEDSISGTQNNEQQKSLDNKEFSNAQLIEMARAYRVAKEEYIPGHIEIDGESGDTVLIHLYDEIDDHLATSDWYYINRFNGKGTDVLNQEIDLTVILKGNL